MAEVKKMATRDGYGKALVELGKEHQDIVVLDADLAGSTKSGMFGKAYPGRHFNCGIAEADMMCVAAGLAAAGMTPFASSFAMFAAGRAFEQVRNCIGYPHLNVKIGATHAGITVGEDGATHQCNEDIALMRTIPGMVIINPADATEAYACVEAALKHDGPVYLRFGRYAVPDLTAELEGYTFELGRGVTYCDGTDVTLIATGVMSSFAYEAASVLREEGISARVINIHTIKPIDKEIIVKAARETGAIVTAEEHNIIGGLGSAVMEVVSEECPVPVVRVGVQDLYGRSGTVPELMRAYGLTTEDIVSAAKRAIAKK